MTATLAVAMGAVGLAAGWLLDALVTQAPRRERSPAHARRSGDSDLAVAGDDPAAPQEAGAPAALAPSTARQIVEALVCGGLFAALAVRFEDSWALPAYLVLAAALVVLSAIDLELYVLPNRIVYPLAVATVVLLAIASLGDDDFGAYTRALVAGAVAFVAFFVLHLISPRSMGFGDVKLSFVLGMSLGWLGSGEALLGLFLGFVYGAVVGLVLIATRRRARNQALPFGPFLAAGTLTAVLVGQAIIDWYRGG